MKKTLLITTSLMLVVGFSSGQVPIYGSTFVWKDGLVYAPDSDKPYSGKVVVYYDNKQKDNKQKKYEGTYKDGKPDGEWFEYYENGKLGSLTIYEDGESWSIRCYY